MQNRQTEAVENQYRYVGFSSAIIYRRERRLSEPVRQEVHSPAARCCRGSEHRFQHTRKAFLKFFCAQTIEESGSSLPGGDNSSRSNVYTRLQSQRGVGMTEAIGGTRNALKTLAQIRFVQQGLDQ